MNCQASQTPQACAEPSTVEACEVEVPVRGGTLGALVFDAPQPRGYVVLGQPSGIARLSWCSRFLATTLAHAGFTTLLIDLVTEDEDIARRGTHDDVALLAERLLLSAHWLRAHRAVAGGLPLAWVGVGASAAAAFIATTSEPDRVLAIISRDGRPDHAGASLLLARVPALFIVDGRDPVTLSTNRVAVGLSPRWQLEVVTSDTGELVEDVAVDRVAALSTAWLSHCLAQHEAWPRLASFTPPCAVSGSCAAQ